MQAGMGFGGAPQTVNVNEMVITPLPLRSSTARVTHVVLMHTDAKRCVRASSQSLTRSARVASGTAAVPGSYEVANALRDGFAGQLNVYRTMAHHPALVRAWAPMRQHVVKDTALGLERSEVVILRTGHRMGSAYEWAHRLGMVLEPIIGINGGEFRPYP